MDSDKYCEENDVIEKKENEVIVMGAFKMGWSERASLES